jgi:uncharacterized protein (TIGR00661 family)
LSPLNWGIGHAARLVPIAHHLHACGNTIFICASGEALNLMQLECAYAQFVDDIHLNVSYGKSKSSTSFKLLFQLPSMWLHVYNEHQWLNKLINQHQIEMVIADNRYGFYHKNVPCVFITHQLNIKVPFGAKFINFLNHYFIKKFDACWVPDFESNEKALAGELSRKNELQNIVYLGPLSRANAIVEQSNKKAPVLYLLSGLEPQRTILEKLILKRHTQHPHQAILIRGTMHSASKIEPQHNLIVYELCNAKQLQSLVSASKYVVCRSGYSSIMDLVGWQKNALLIPTPGQYEQEYLAEYLSEKKWFYSSPQNNFLQFKEVDLDGFQCPKNEYFAPVFMELFETI